MSGPVTVSYTGDEVGTITNGTDTITFSEIEQLILTDKNDVLDATNSRVGVNIMSGAGNDRITDNGGDDLIDAGDGDDYISGYGVNGLGAHTSNVNTDNGSDDTLIEGAGHGTLLVGEGDDNLDGSAANDSLRGGDDNDVFTYAAGDGADTIVDFNTGNIGALGDGVLNQSNNDPCEADCSDNDQMADGDSIRFVGAARSSFTADNTGVVCFTAGRATRPPVTS